MRKVGTRLVYSPTDLSRFMESRFGCWMRRRALESPDDVRPDAITEDTQALFAKGRRHELGVLERLRGEGRDVHEVSAEGDRVGVTREAMRAGREVIYQAALAAGEFSGTADFLVKIPESSRLGDYRYEPLEAKLERRPRPTSLVQLCCYAEMLEAAQGAAPGRVRLALGGGERVALRLDDYRYYYLSLKEEFLRFMGEFDAAEPPVPEAGEVHREWQSHADERLERLDHLSRVARITGAQIRKLEAAGITTMRELAVTDRTRVPRMHADVLRWLKAQARLQVDSADLERPLYEVRAPDPANPERGLASLPPGAPLDVYFDIEGYPLAADNLEYLFGATHVEDGERRFADWWAHDTAAERRALEGFVDWVVDRRRRDPRMHVYHYGAYEITALKRLMGKHGSREREIDDLLRGGVFIDLYRVVRGGIQVGEPRYSLKNLERLFRSRREGEVGTALDSIAYYERWLASGEPGDWRESPILEQIRGYNRDDCDSTLMLAEWLRERQREHGIGCRGGGASGDAREANGAPEPTASPAAELAARLSQERAGAASGPRAELLGQLVEFHRREDRPMWWAMFDRHAMTEDELIEDVNCLGGLERSRAAPVEEGNYLSYEYVFDPEQETKLAPGAGCYFAHDLESRARIGALRLEAGRVRVRLSRRVLAGLGGEPPRRLSLIPDEYVRSHVIVDSIRRTVRRWLEGQPLPRALGDFLDRRPPRLRGGNAGPLVRVGETPVDAALRVAPLMDDTTLSIQGPPGTGKTTTAARMVLHLLAQGSRIGLTSNSHKAILNLLRKCAELAEWNLPCLKAGGGGEDFFERCRGAVHVETAANAVPLLDRHPLVAGTAWLFSRPELQERLDYLFVDEAGQVSVANLSGMAPCARNIVLVGDQMQLPQPIQGAHPGASGRSTLEYLFEDRRTVPAEMGIFLGTSFRLHPRLCELISGAFYEGRLRSAADCANRVLRLPANPGPGASARTPSGAAGRDARSAVTSAGGAQASPRTRCVVSREAGVLFVPVEHEGNAQGSDEEVAAVRAIVDELTGLEHSGLDGAARGHLGPRDILVVAPYNLQVRKLRRRLADSVRVGTVDRFQGQEAPVVILSMCSSDAGSARGVEFLMNPNRLNVALSRAQVLAIVVGHPGLARTRCSTVEMMRRVNLYCRIVDARAPRMSG